MHYGGAGIGAKVERLVGTTDLKVGVMRSSFPRCLLLLPRENHLNYLRVRFPLPFYVGKPQAFMVVLT
jgi:hypothetical protein